MNFICFITKKHSYGIKYYRKGRCIGICRRDNCFNEKTFDEKEVTSAIVKYSMNHPKVGII